MGAGGAGWQGCRRVRAALCQCLAADDPELLPTCLRAVPLASLTTIKVSLHRTACRGTTTGVQQRLMKRGKPLGCAQSRAQREAARAALTRPWSSK